MSNVKLGALGELRLHLSQVGVPAGHVKLASGMVYPTDAEGRPIIPQVAVGLPPEIQSKSSAVYSDPDSEGNQVILSTTEEKFATDAVTGRVLAKHTVTTDAEGRVSEKKSGDVAILGLEPSPFNFIPILLGVGAIGALALAFKG